MIPRTTYGHFLSVGQTYGHTEVIADLSDKYFDKAVYNATDPATWSNCWHVLNRKKNQYYIVYSPPSVQDWRTTIYHSNEKEEVTLEPNVRVNTPSMALYWIEVGKGGTEPEPVINIHQTKSTFPLHRRLLEIPGLQIIYDNQDEFFRKIEVVINFFLDEKERMTGAQESYYFDIDIAGKCVTVRPRECGVYGGSDSLKLYYSAIPAYLKLMQALHDYAETVPISDLKTLLSKKVRCRF